MASSFSSFSQLISLSRAIHHKQPPPFNNNNTKKYFLGDSVSTPCLFTIKHAHRRAAYRPVLKQSMAVRAETIFVNGDDARKMVSEEGYAVLDVRDKTQYERAHIKTCYHVPLFIENTDGDFGTVIKRTVHNNFAGLFFGLPFTKLNPEFVESVMKNFSSESRLLLVCQEGLRSTAAARKLEDAGFKNLSCITSGLQSVKSGTFDSVGATELKDAGKAGLVTVQGKISAVLGTILVCAFLFITFFPEQAEKLLQMIPIS